MERGQDILRRLYRLAHTAIRFVCGLYGHCSQWLRLASAAARGCRLLCTELRSKRKPFLKLRVQTSANRQIPEFAKPDKLLYGTLAFSAEVIAQVHERHTLLGERYVNWPAPFWEGGYDPIEGLRKVPCNRTWDDIRGRNRKVVVEARDRIPSEEVRQH